MPHAPSGMDVSGVEKTLVECVVRPNYAGGAREVLDAFRRAKGTLRILRMTQLLNGGRYLFPYEKNILFYMERAGYPERQKDLVRQRSRPDRREFTTYLEKNMHGGLLDPDIGIYYPESEPDRQWIIEKAPHALFSIDELAGKIALHGDQALIAYDISHRASQDIDLYVRENTITKHQTDLIRKALTEEFNDSGMEIRKFKTVGLPSKTEPKRLTRITAGIARRDGPVKGNRKSPVLRFGPGKGLNIEISLNSNMLHLSTLDSGDVAITVFSLTRIVYEKTLSSCENSPGYRRNHPGKGNTGDGLRTKDMFDIFSILRGRPETSARLTTTAGIGFLTTLMGDAGMTRNDLAIFRNDMTLYKKRYREEYETMNQTLVSPEERIAFTDAETTMLNLLTLLIKET